MFVTQFVPHSRVFTNAGSRVHILHKPVIDENGHMELVESGKENIYDFIQSFKDSCDISLIVKRFTNGEIDVLSRRQGMFLMLRSCRKIWPILSIMFVMPKSSLKLSPLKFVQSLAILLMNGLLLLVLLIF